MLGLQGAGPQVALPHPPQVGGPLRQLALAGVLGGHAAVTVVTAQYLKVIVQVVNGSSSVPEQRECF